jgi:Na+-driven multidrug efflux pump
MPAMFGIGFKDAVTMALVLLPASVLQGLQWVICRLWAARGRGTLLLTSCGAMLVAMIALDIVLVPAHGGIGAAVASLVASAVGAAVALAGHRRRAGGDASLRHFVPHVADFRRIAELPRAVWARIAGRATA